MKRQHAEVGVKYWGNQDLLDLQTEPFKALDGFFAQYGPCIVQGCEVSESENTFDITPGLVVLEGVDHRGAEVSMIVPFEGITGTSLPVYLTLAYTAQSREYGDGKVKPIAYDYHAQACGVIPAAGTKHLSITAGQTPRFVDVLGDDKHSFITDIERTVWNGKETTAGAQTKSEAALRSAKTYTDQRETVVRTDIATADTATLRSAKSYADTVVAALVDGSPEALNTLQELATALGNDPNFATTVMQLIGEKLPTTTFEAFKSKVWTTENFDPSVFLKTDVKGWRVERDCDNMTEAGTYDVNSNEEAFVNAPFWNYGQIVAIKTFAADAQIAFEFNSGNMYVRCRYGGSNFSQWRRLYHSGNFNPADKSDISHSHDGVVGLNWHNPDMNGFVYGHYIIAKRTAFGSGQSRLYIKAGDTIIDGVQVQHASSCPWEGVSGKTNANTSTDGLMSRFDKTKLDNSPVIGVAGRVTAAGGKDIYRGAANVDHLPGSGTYVVNSNSISPLSIIMLTPLNADRAVYLAVKNAGNFTVKATSLANTGMECGFEFVVINSN